MYTLCNSHESIDTAIGHLSRAHTVFLDCEGVNLGCAGGRLSLICLGTIVESKSREEKLHVFVIDVMAFKSKKNKSIRRVLDWLRRHEACKVVYDGRMDASEMHHWFKVDLDNVVDLQVADLLSRKRRGEGTDAQMKRLFTLVPEDEIVRNRPLYSQLERLNGLDAACREQGLTVPPKTRT